MHFPVLRIIALSLTLLPLGILFLPQTGLAEVVHLSLREAANRGFRDGVAGDGVGGWTDQGPENDLSTLQPGILKTSALSFEILDPLQNDGKSALVLGQVLQRVAADTGEAASSDHGPAVKGISGEMATLKPSSTGPFRNLYLLHAFATPPAPPKPPAPIGRIVLHYADGSHSRHEIVDKKDIGNWRDPLPAPNADVVWESENPTASIGLYASRIPIEEKPIDSISFIQAGSTPWMIVGISASLEKIQVGTLYKGHTVKQGTAWAPYDHSLDIEPSSIFDFSSLLDAPAGKYGPLQATNSGHFEFAERPGTLVRFWGVNLCFTAQFLEKEEADLLADRLARSGYNSVRFHHFDADLTRDTPNSWDLNPQALDKLDYLFAALKKRGIYLNIDLYSSRHFREAEIASWNVPGANRDHFKPLLPINEAVYKAWEHFATSLLSHKNPYTGLTWAEDPALIGICPVNENPLFNRIDRDPFVLEAYAKAFADAGGVGPANASNPSFNRFIYETNARSDARMMEHLRALGTRALLTGANYTIAQGLTFVREKYDYVDCHSYWDHPKFPGKSWTFPMQFGQGSATSAKAKVPTRMMPTRIFGLPFVSTEVNFCRPNQYRREGSILLPAYASLQDWSALYNFQYAKDQKMAIHGGTENYFALANDPIGMIGDRVSSLLFQREDIKSAPGAIAYAVRPDEAFSDLGRLFPGEFMDLGLVTRIGSLAGEPAEILTKNPWLSGVVTGSQPPPISLPPRAWMLSNNLPNLLQEEGILPKNSINSRQNRFISETGQIELDSRDRTVRVVTPRSELFLLAPGSTLKGDISSVTAGETPCTVSVIAIDSPENQPLSLATARRILVTHLTDALPEGMLFGHSDRKLLKAWGDGPHLLERGDATLSLRLPEGKWTAWAVASTGKRLHEIPLDFRDGLHTLHLSTLTDKGTQLAYELERTP